MTLLIAIGNKNQTTQLLEQTLNYLEALDAKINIKFVNLHLKILQKSFTRDKLIKNTINA